MYLFVCNNYLDLVNVMVMEALVMQLLVKNVTVKTILKVTQVVSLVVYLISG